MFRTLARLFVDPTLSSPGASPDVLKDALCAASRFLTWHVKSPRSAPPPFAIGDPAKPFLGEPASSTRSGFPSARRSCHPASALGPNIPDAYTGAKAGLAVPLIWDHLILRLPHREHRSVRDPRRGAPSLRHRRDSQVPLVARGGHRWVRATEELFFRDPPLFTIQQRRQQPPPRHPHQPPQRVLADVRPRTSRILMPPSLGAPPVSAEQSWQQDTGGGSQRTTSARSGPELLRQLWFGF